MPAVPVVTPVAALGDNCSTLSTHLENGTMFVIDTIDTPLRDHNFVAAIGKATFNVAATAIRARLFTGASYLTLPARSAATISLALLILLMI